MKGSFSPSDLQHLKLNISRVNGVIQPQQQQQPERMWWICLIGTSKSNIFQHLKKGVREKQSVFWQSVAVRPPLSMNTQVWVILPALRVHHLKEMIYLSKSSLLFDPMGSWSRSRGDARLPMCVFAIPSLPFLPLFDPLLRSAIL